MNSKPITPMQGRVLGGGALPQERGAEHGAQARHLPPIRTSRTLAPQPEMMISAQARHLPPIRTPRPLAPQHLLPNHKPYTLAPQHLPSIRKPLTLAPQSEMINDT